MRLVSLGIVFAAVHGVGHSQTTEPVTTAFEVASVKPSGPKSLRGSDFGPGSSDPTRYYFHSASLLDLIITAYKVEVFQVSSKTALDRQTFDLDTKLPANTTKKQFQVMLQNLLAERFHLKLHIESKEFPAYALVVSKGEPRLNQPAEGANFPNLAPGRPGFERRDSRAGGFRVVRMRAQKQPISWLATMLQSPNGRTVVDQTGLTETYDFTLEFSEEIPNADSPPGAPVAPDLFKALQQQLGLQLVAKRIPFDVVVIDSVDKMPTEN